jgi:DNA-binding SARP family transcriptional activator
MLRLKSLGETLIEVDGARLTPAAETVFATALYLIIETGRPVGRDELTRLFWPGVSETQAQHGLRQVLYRLKTLGALIQADRAALILDPRFCSTDFAELLAPQSSAALELLASDIGGSFLPGYRPQLSDEFGNWVERQRDMVHSALSRVLVGGMQAKKRGSDWNGAEQFASLCLTMDPLNEEATLTVAESAALGGSKTKALSILNHYLEEIGENASEIKLPAVLLRRRISEAYQNNIFPVRDAPFVGREEEMAELTGALARAQAGNGSAYVIWGEPGIGKTRLVQEFTRVAALQRVHIVRVGCQSHDVRRPLSVFVDMVPKLLALQGALGCSPESMKYLRRLTALDPEAAREREEYEEVDFSYSGARSAIFDVLDAVSSERCCLLELEDAQWLDRQSIRLVEELASYCQTRRILFLVTSRTTALNGELIAKVALRPLRGGDSLVVAHALATGTNAFGADFLAWCISSAGGNPYYLIELLRHGTMEGSAFQAPASLARLLHARVSLLSEGARRVLELCCVLGKHSSLERIDRCIGLSRSTLLGALHEIDCSGMIEIDGAQVLCRHDLLSSVVLAQMGDSQKAMLHRYVAAQLEDEADSTHSVSLIWESAEHWLSAAESIRAIELLRRFGTYLMDVGMPEEAALVLQRAGLLTNAPSERYAIGTEHARALMRADNPGDAIAVLSGLRNIRSSLHPCPSPLDEVGLLTFRARWENGESIPESASECLAALSCKTTSSAERVSAATWLSMVADNLCDHVLAEQTNKVVSDDLLDSSINPIERLSFQMIHHCSVGDGKHAVSIAGELASYVRQHCVPIVAVRHLRNVAHVNRCHGRADLAISVMEEAFGIAERLNKSSAMGSCACKLGSLFMQIGDNHTAADWIARAVEAHTPGNRTVADTNMWSHRTELAIRLFRLDDAKQCYSNCLPGVASAKCPRTDVRALSLEARIALLQDGRVSDSAIKSLSDVFELTKYSCFQDFSAEALILSLESNGRISDARDVARSYVSKQRRDLSELWVPLANVMRRVLE